ncbi:MAG: hypothetical protein EZS28_008892, partial [Streblomastix strix]
IPYAYEQNKILRMKQLYSGQYDDFSEDNLDFGFTDEKNNDFFDSGFSLVSNYRPQNNQIQSYSSQQQLSPSLSSSSSSSGYSLTNRPSSISYFYSSG